LRHGQLHRGGAYVAAMADWKPSSSQSAQFSRGHHYVKAATAKMSTAETLGGGMLHRANRAFVDHLGAMTSCFVDCAHIVSTFRTEEPHFCQREQVMTALSSA